jgi:MYXO-CTERM domain-containing protein
VDVTLTGGGYIALFLVGFASGDYYTIDDSGIVYFLSTTAAATVPTPAAWPAGVAMLLAMTARRRRR